jgi:hypothetical protein
MYLVVSGACIIIVKKEKEKPCMREKSTLCFVWQEKTGGGEFCNFGP